MPIFGPFCGIGYQDDLVGEAGAYVPARVTGAEVDTIVRRYFEELRHIRDFSEYYSGSREMRMEPYANMRISQFINQGAISEERADQIYKDVFADFEKSVDPGEADDSALP